MQKNGTADSTIDSLKSGVRQFVDAGGERAGMIKDKAIDVKDAFVKNGGKALKASGSWIKEHPFIAIGIGFGVGYLVVRMVRN